MTHYEKMRNKKMSIKPLNNAINNIYDTYFEQREKRNELNKTLINMEKKE